MRLRHTSHQVLKVVGVDGDNSQGENIDSLVLLGGRHFDREIIGLCMCLERDVMKRTGFSGELRPNPAILRAQATSATRSAIAKHLTTRFVAWHHFTELAQIPSAAFCSRRRLCPEDMISAES